MQTGEVFKEFVDQANIIIDWYEDEIEPKVETVPNLISYAGKPQNIAVVCVDMIKDFCDPERGALGSERIKAIIPSIVELLSKLNDVGVEDFILVQDSHSEDSPEFNSYGPHATRDTWGAEPIFEIWDLPNDFTVFLKNNLNPIFSHFLLLSHFLYGREDDAHAFCDYLGYFDSKGVRTVIVVGNCTDLCVRETAMLIRFWANHYNKDVRVIIPENCVQTFDLPKEDAEKVGAKPHPGDMMHLLSLYEMSRNGIDVVGKIL